MLKGLDPLLSPDLLWILAAMGHGDDLAIVDGLHPAEAIARKTASGRLIRMPGLDITRVAQAILSVMPLDDFVPDPVRRMEVVGNSGEIPPVQQAMQRVVDVAVGRSLPMVAIERHAFYAAEKACFAVVQVGDIRPYGCFLMRKGVVRF